MTPAHTHWQPVARVVGARARASLRGAGAEFPKNFVEVVKLAFKRLFRVMAHIYYAHFDKIVILNEDAHLNTLFTHFVAFATHFKLLDDKELAPMRDLTTELSRAGSVPVAATGTGAGAGADGAPAATNGAPGAALS